MDSRAIWEFQTLGALFTSPSNEDHGYIAFHMRATEFWKVYIAILSYELQSILWIVGPN